MTKNLSQVTRYPGRNLNPGSHPLDCRFRRRKVLSNAKSIPVANDPTSCSHVNRHNMDSGCSEHDRGSHSELNTCSESPNSFAERVGPRYVRMYKADSPC